MRLFACLVLLLALALPAAAQTCHTTKCNLQGVAGAAITVSSTAITIAAANTSRCQLFIYNSSANDMTCAAAGDRVPTAAAGVPIPSKQWFKTNLEGGELWQCIRSGSSDATAVVCEALP